ncbi:MAG: 16S rRNA (guanine(527)-N(7))-methyltransferase RsmG [Rhabdaerophilum sp.]
MNAARNEAQARDALVARGLVSRETLSLLDRYVELLRLWQSRTNLIAPSTCDEIWARHILDSAQLLQIRPEARTWVDLGSGGGLPGLVLACAMREMGGYVDLIESNGKKASFLRHVATSLDLPCGIHAERIEASVPKLPIPHIVTARALADLDSLLGLASSLLKRGAVGLFPKGRDHQTELTRAAEHWHFSYALHESATDPQARVVEITELRK